MKLYRHGDILIREIEEIPSVATSIENKVLSEGETTGHKHQLHGQVSIYQTGENKFIEVQDIAELTHQEHKTIQIEQGTYEVVREREFDPFHDLKKIWMADMKRAEVIIRERSVSD